MDPASATTEQQTATADASAVGSSGAVSERRTSIAGPALAVEVPTAPFGPAAVLDGDAGVRCGMYTDAAGFNEHYSSTTGCLGAPSVLDTCASLLHTFSRQAAPHVLPYTGVYYIVCMSCPSMLCCSDDGDAPCSSRPASPLNIHSLLNRPFGDVLREICSGLQVRAVFMLTKHCMSRTCILPNSCAHQSGNLTQPDSTLQVHTTATLTRLLQRGG